MRNKISLLVKTKYKISKPLEAIKKETIDKKIIIYFDKLR